METQSDGNEDTIANIKDIRQRLEARIESQQKTHLELLASIQAIIPNIVSSLDLSLKVVSSFNDRPFAPTPSLPLPLHVPDPKFNPKRSHPFHAKSQSDSSLEVEPSGPMTPNPKISPDSKPIHQWETESGSPLAVVRSMVAICLLGRVPFLPIDSSTVLRKLENDRTVELGGECKSKSRPTSWHHWL